MTTYTPKQLKDTLAKHKEWLDSKGKRGIKANLSGANLYYANLFNANLFNANLSNANLSNADLYYANLSK